MRLDEVQEVAASVAAGVVRRHAEGVDRDARWPEESVRALQAAGLAGLVVSLSAGGLGHGLLAVAKVCMHCVGGSAVIATTDLLRLWTGRALLGIPLLGE